LSADEIASTLTDGPPFLGARLPRCGRYPRDWCLPGCGSVSVSFARVRHCPPPAARASSGQVKCGEGCLRMPVRRLGKRVGV